MNMDPYSSNTYEKYAGTIYDFSITSKMRGTWYAMLVDAAGADESTIEERKLVCKQIRRKHEYFQCGKCKPHFGQYLVTNPPEAVVHNKNGLFKWVVNFLNSVQERLNKELYEYNVLYDMFHIPEFFMCSRGESAGNNSTKDNPNNSVNFESRFKGHQKANDLDYRMDDNKISRSHYRDW